MLIAGLTGGMGCGKSFVARAFADLGCRVIEADELGHQVMQPGAEAFEPVVAAFGRGILAADGSGSIDRAALAAVVFGNPAELERLNAIVHPAVRARSARLTREIAAADPHAIVIYVAAILIESGIYRQMDKVILVTCTREQQLQRALSRPGAIESDIRARLQRQMPQEEKEAFADYLIDASGTEPETLRQTAAVWENLNRLASRTALA